MFLDDFALGLLIFVAIVLLYGIVAIHDIPHKIAKDRGHPHQDAIHAAGWISVFTLHVIWPFLWIWATSYREDSAWGLSAGKSGVGNTAYGKKVAQHDRLDPIESEGVIVGSVKTRPNIAKISTVRPNSSADNSRKDEDIKVGEVFKEGVVPGSLKIRPKPGSKSRPMSAADFLPREDGAKEKEIESAEEGVVAGSSRAQPNTASFTSTRPLTAADFLPEEDDAKDKEGK